MSIKESIKDEKHDERKYRRMARKHPSEKIAIDSIATDENKHARMLKEIKRKKALGKCK